VVIPLDERIEARLLLEHIRRGGLRRVLLEREMHPFVPSVLLRVPRLDALDARFFVGQVDHTESHAEFRSVRMKKVVDSQSEMEQMPGGDSRRVRHIVGRSLSRDPQSSGTEFELMRRRW